MQRFFTPPNQLTFLRILLTPVFVGTYLSGDPVYRQLSLAVFVVAMLTDWYDGWVARRWGFVTRWGSYFDPFADKIFISAALFAFAALDIIPVWTVWVIVARDVAITFLRTFSELKGKPFDTSMFAKTKTFLQYLAIIYVLTLDVGRSFMLDDQAWQRTINMLLDKNVIEPMMIGVALLTLATGLAYLYSNRTSLREMYGATD